MFEKALGRGDSGIRPCVGFSPMVPVNAAGMRIEPPASLPIDTRTMPAATAAAQPPLLPPGVSVGFRGYARDPSRAVGDAFPVEFWRARLAPQDGAGIGQPLD